MSAVLNVHTSYSIEELGDLLTELRSLNSTLTEVHEALYQDVSSDNISVHQDQMLGFMAEAGAVLNSVQSMTDTILVSATGGRMENLNQLVHVGDVREERLRLMGLNTIRLISEADPVDIDEIKGITLTRAIEVVKHAKKIIHERDQQALTALNEKVTGQADEDIDEDQIFSMSENS